MLIRLILILNFKHFNQNKPIEVIFISFTNSIGLKKESSKKLLNVIKDSDFNTKKLINIALGKSKPQTTVASNKNFST